VLWSVCNEAHRPYLSGPLLHGEGGRLTLAACNGHTLVQVVTDSDLPAGASDIILGPKFCRIAQSLAGEAKEPVTLAWREGKASLDAGSVSLIGKAIEGTFPDYRRVIPGESTRVVVDPESLRDAVRRVTMIATEKTRAIKLERGN